MRIDTHRLQEILEEIEALREEALCITEEARYITEEARCQGYSSIYDRAQLGWSAEIETAMSRSNGWLGQISADTFEETIDACEALNVERDLAKLAV